MRMNRFLAVLLGLLSVLPLAAVPLFMNVLFPQMQTPRSPRSAAAMFESNLLILAGMLVVAIFVAFVWRSRRVPQAKKRMWSSAIIVGSLFTIPVFWYLYIWKDRPLEKRPTLEEYVAGAP